ncbi:cell death abnormality protein 1-like [Gigantopelta aegis]|uniref:cell death abnormality protein 1-like n=1 Tax=Gigantopelta aegis TaxID=1735272 RepID=UPI001B889EA6|nr:cell death abnormality protein 1-like [Gigantopelta aegis]
MTCRGPFEIGINWYRPDGEEVRDCIRGKYRCPRYSGYYGRPHVDANLTRDTLEIESFDQEKDGGNWTCRDGRDSKSFGTCWLGPTKEKGEALHIDCYSFSATGQQTYITCRSGFRLGVHWFRPDGKIVRRCDTTKLKCSVADGYRGYPIVGGGIASDTLVLESFDPNVDDGYWTCRDGRDGTQFAECLKTLMPGRQKVCADGHWGHSCKKCGHCKESSCNKSTGRCQCETGWDGSTCTFCADGYWGQTCKKCGDCNGSSCNKRTGSCQCETGWAGSTCTICADGYWGQYCKKCGHCKDSSCDKKTGSCQCETGWAGSTCTKPIPTTPTTTPGMFILIYNYSGEQAVESLVFFRLLVGTEFGTNDCVVRVSVMQNQYQYKRQIVRAKAVIICQKIYKDMFPNHVTVFGRK